MSDSTTNTTDTSTEKKPNSGWFKKGHDPRRHQFTREECQLGFEAALLSICKRYPDAVGAFQRHMSCEFLQAVTARRGSNPNYARGKRKCSTRELGLKD